MLELVLCLVLFFAGVLVGKWYYDIDLGPEDIKETFVFFVDVVDEKFIAYSFPDSRFLIQADTAEGLTDKIKSKFPQYIHYIGLPINLMEELVDEPV